MRAERRTSSITQHDCCLALGQEALALGLAAVMGAYNTAAWLRCRRSHLAVNAAIYLAAVFWEQRHVTHHLIPCLPAKATSVEATTPIPDEPSEAKVP